MRQHYFLLLVVLLAEQGRPQGTNNCRTGWKFFQESCYHFGSQKATWPEAEAYCWSMNSRLVEIETEAESNYLESQLRTIHQHASESGVDQNEVSYWLGGNDIEIEGVFKWVKSDQPLTYTDWSPGQPDDANGEDCMELRGRSSTTGMTYPVAFPTTSFVKRRKEFLEVPSKSKYITLSLLINGWGYFLAKLSSLIRRRDLCSGL